MRDPHDRPRPSIFRCCRLNRGAILRRERPRGRFPWETKRILRAGSMHVQVGNYPPRFVKYL